MARIKLKFYDKEYIIEYKNRDEVKAYFVDLQELYDKLEKIDPDKNVKDYVLVSSKALEILIKAGLVEHHKDNMPSDEDIKRWITTIPNATAFYEKLMSMIQEVVSSVEEDAKNLSWEVEEN